MIVHQITGSLRDFLNTQVSEGKTIGFVPTMGALHQGHLQLMQASLSSSDLTVCSIFVNPTQFNDPADFQKYPVTIGADLDLLFQAGVDAVFIPSVDEIYPGGMKPGRVYNLEGLDSRLEGKFRPGHFQGVCQVMDRLLTIVKPDRLFMGQKDFQQCLVIRKLLKIMGGEIALEIFPTVRETNGLAMSSRNKRLFPEEKNRAAVIFETLTELKKNLLPGSLEDLRKTAEKTLEAARLRVDYIEIAETDDLQSVDLWDGQQSLVALVAAFLGEVRLIDNILLT